MKSTLIKDTTKEERIALIRQWIPAEDGLEDCEIDLWDMYRDYINGEREIAEINAAFAAGIGEFEVQVFMDFGIVTVKC